MWIVRLALRRPYTFVVAAILIMVVGVVSIARTPVDIFPNIDIPVVSVLWQYTGLSPEEMSDRIVYNYERSLTTTVNNIEHIESQSLSGRAIVKIFFQPGVNIGDAIAQVTAISQSSVHSMPPGTLPPFIIQYSASTVPILQLGHFGPGTFRAGTGRPFPEFPARRSDHDSRRLGSVSLRRKTAASPGGPEYAGHAGQGIIAGGRRKCDRRPKPDSPRGHRQDRQLRIPGRDEWRARDDR